MLPDCSIVCLSFYVVKQVDDARMSHCYILAPVCGRQRTRKTNLQGFLIPDIPYMERLAVEQHCGGQLQEDQPCPQDGHHLPRNMNDEHAGQATALTTLAGA